MLHRFLTSESEARRVADILSELAKANGKIEFLTRQIVNSVGDQTARLSVDSYDYLLRQNVAGNLKVGRSMSLHKKSFDIKHLMKSAKTRLLSIRRTTQNGR